jgi:hypothetical protein
LGKSDAQVMGSREGVVVVQENSQVLFDFSIVSSRCFMLALQEGGMILINKNNSSSSLVIQSPKNIALSRFKLIIQVAFAPAQILHLTLRNKI